MDQPTSAQPSTPEQPAAPVQAAPASETTTQPAASASPQVVPAPVAPAQSTATPSQTQTMPTAPDSAGSQKKSFLSRYKFTLISIVIVLFALVPLVFLSKHVQAPVKPVAQKVTITPTPTIAPMTQQNAVPTIDATQNSIDNAVSQANQDLQAAGNVNTSQDSISGL